MKKSEMLKLSFLYHSAQWGGADKILKDFYDLESDLTIPFSIAHGIDLHQTTLPLDVRSIEPIHWAYNNKMYLKSKFIKPSIQLPHPFLLIKTNKIIKKMPFLIIAPPPSETNDENLYMSLKSHGYNNYHILVKERGDSSSSYNFWEEKGIKTVTAGHPDQNFYFNLHQLMSSYDCLVGCTMSGALVFGAALGCKINIIQDFAYLNYETHDYEDVLDSNSETPKNFLELAIGNHQNDLQKISREILGDEFLADYVDRRNSILQIIEATKDPIFWSVQRSALEKSFRVRLATFFKKPFFLSGSVINILKKFLPQSVVKVRINEIDMYLNGKNKSNFEIEKVKYKKNINEPGSGAN
jgi:hypothetical protein